MLSRPSSAMAKLFLYLALQQHAAALYMRRLELALLQDELVTQFTDSILLAPPICFRQAVIGLGSQCALGYCKNIPLAVHHSFRDFIADYYWETPRPGSDTSEPHRIPSLQQQFRALATTTLSHPVVRVPWSLRKRVGAESDSEFLQLSAQKWELDLLTGPEYPRALMGKYNERIMEIFLEVFWKDPPLLRGCTANRRACAGTAEGSGTRASRGRDRSCKGRAQTRAQVPAIPQLPEKQSRLWSQRLQADPQEECDIVVKSLEIHSIDDPTWWGLSAADNAMFEGLEEVPDWISCSLVDPETQRQFVEVHNTTVS
ncbi:MAG: hypothetical protein J3R72DRAFT_497794 [Linnemannia gamsii]|nr:MAG: hypothetical protein J3R72DRAFT_497794 [Linnemannia gamsii]